MPTHVVENQGWVHPTSRVVGPIRRLLPYKAFQDRSLSTITPGLPLSLGRSRETTDSRFPAVKLPIAEFFTLPPYPSFSLRETWRNKVCQKLSKPAEICRVSICIDFCAPSGQCANSIFTWKSPYIHGGTPIAGWFISREIPDIPAPKMDDD